MRQQIVFSQQLQQAKRYWLLPALQAAVGLCEIVHLDQELAQFAPVEGVKLLAQRNLRGEIVFAVPNLLTIAPRLLGYYRLLLGYSRKEFYQARCQTERYRTMEDSGELGRVDDAALATLCLALNARAFSLLQGIEQDVLEAKHLEELTLLTIGPQLRGAANVTCGINGIRELRIEIERLLDDAMIETKARNVLVVNPANRRLRLRFGSDPDVCIEELPRASGLDTRKILAIEVKAGTDFSNIHNRLGEAEKSHQKAAAKGYTNRWTVVNVENFDYAMAKRESPFTTEFFRLQAILDPLSEEGRRFREHIRSLLGLAQE